MNISPEEENRAFNEIMQGLSGDAEFNRKVSKANRRMAKTSTVAYSAIILSVGVIVLLGSIQLFSGFLEIVGGIFGFLIMISAGLLFEHGKTTGTPGALKTETPFMKNLEDKWEERLRREGRA